MDTLQLPLPEGMKAWLAQEAARAGLATPADFALHLLRQRQEREAMQEELEKELRKAVDGPPGELADEAYWRERFRRLEEGRHEGQT
jgi:hypothetical protein